MPKLILDFHAGRRDVVLVESQFTDSRLPAHAYPGRQASCRRGGRHGFGWRRGFQSLIALLVRAKACWLAHADGDAARTFRLRGPRGTLAASLNDLLTKGSNSLRRMFGAVQLVPLYRDLFVRENSDYKTDPQADVHIALAPNFWTPDDITIRVDGRTITDPGELASIAHSIERQWQGTQPTVASSAPATPGTTASVAAASSHRDEWRRRLASLESLTDFAAIDGAWGELIVSWLRESDPATEAALLAADLPEPWGALLQAHVLVRRGRWSDVLRRLRAAVQLRWQCPSLAAPDAVWAGRAANQVGLAAIRAGDEHTARECLAWVEQLVPQWPGSAALRAQLHHFRARYLWWHHYQDLEPAGRDLDTAWDTYLQLPASSPWREMGLAHVADSRAEHLASIGELTLAVAAFRDSIDRKERIGDVYGQSISHGKLGRLYLEAFELEQATAELNADLALTRRLQDPRGESVALLGLAEVCLLAAERTPDQAAPSLAAALTHLDAALAIAGRSGNDVGTGLALVGKARRLLLPARIDQGDAQRAAEWAAAGLTLLTRCTRRPEWKRYAQLWLGWAQARQAESADQLDQIDQQFFQPAIEDLRAAGLRVELAEALYQRARMLMTEGRRLASEQHVRDRVAESLSEAWEQASLMQVKSLTQRYLGLARHIDPDLWLRTVVRHKREAARTTAANRRLRLLAEDRWRALLLAVHELAEPIQWLRGWARESATGKSPPAAPAQAVEHLASIERTLSILSQPLDFAPRSDVAVSREPMVACDVTELLDRVAARVRHAMPDAPVELTVMRREPLPWTTFPALLEIIVYHAASHAAGQTMQCAERSRPSRATVEAGVTDGHLTIDMTYPADDSGSWSSDWQHWCDLRPGTDEQTEVPHPLRGICLARYLARRLGGDVLPLREPADETTSRLRIILPGEAPTATVISRRE